MVKTIHSTWAFLVLLALLIAVVNALVGWLAKKEFSTKDLRLSLFALIFTHLQLVIGVITYFTSPYYDFWKEGNVMKDKGLRLILVEHPTTMILGIIAITMGWSLHKKRPSSLSKFKMITIFYGIGLLLILSRIPWSNWPSAS